MVSLPIVISELDLYLAELVFCAIADMYSRYEED